MEGASSGPGKEAGDGRLLLSDVGGQNWAQGHQVAVEHGYGIRDLDEGIWAMLSGSQITAGWEMMRDETAGVDHSEEG